MNFKMHEMENACMWKSLNLLLQEKNVFFTGVVVIHLFLFLFLLIIV